MICNTYLYNINNWPYYVNFTNNSNGTLVNGSLAGPDHLVRTDEYIIDEYNIEVDSVWRTDYIYNYEQDSNGSFINYTNTTGLPLYNTSYYLYRYVQVCTLYKENITIEDHINNWLTNTSNITNVT